MTDLTTVLLVAEAAVIALSGTVIVYAALAHDQGLLYPRAIALTGLALVASAAATAVFAVDVSPLEDFDSLPYALILGGSIGYLVAGWRLSTTVQGDRDHVLVAVDGGENTEDGFEEAS